MTERTSGEEETGSDEGFLKVNASFGLRSHDLDPNDITRRLGIKPSRSYARGDKYKGHIDLTTIGIRSRAFGIWKVSSEGVVKSNEIQDHVDYLVNLLRPRALEIKALLADAEVYIEVRLWIESSDITNGFTLRSDSVAALAPLCRDFNVSVLGGLRKPVVFPSDQSIPD